MKMPRRVNATRIHALILSSLSVLAYAQLLPGLGNPVIIDNVPHYKGDPLDANLKIDKVLVVQGKPPAGWTPKFEFQVNVRENLPPAPQGCKWQTPVYTPPTGTTNVASGQAGVVQVKNVLVCWPACEGTKLSADLKGVSKWLISGAAPAPVTPVPSIFVPNGPNTEWVQKQGAVANMSNYKGAIDFCLCPDQRAKANVNNYRSDDVGKLSFSYNSSPALLQAGSQWASGANAGPAGSGVLTTVNNTNAPMTVSLVSSLDQGTGPHGWTMTGQLEVDKGYWSACKPQN